jgi:hypothetical protein
LRRRPDRGFVRIRSSRRHTFKLTVPMHLCAHIDFIAPAEKREELVAILDDLIRRLRKIINSTRTKTTVRLRAVEVLAELVRTSYTMVRDVEVEKLERETESLEKEAKRTETENKTKAEPAKSA